MRAAVYGVTESDTTEATAYEIVCNIHTHTHLHTHTHKNPTSEILLREKGVSAMVVYFRLRLSKPVFPKG